jgi:hypothetical protein
MPANQTLSIWKGNSPSFPITISTRTGEALTPVNLTGSTLVFRAVWTNGSLRKEGTGQGFTITNAAAGQATLAFTADETRLLPTGSVARYEIERRIGGGQTTLLYGNLDVSEWANDD